jgi:endonuclease YncB( thermonuclease family)
MATYIFLIKKSLFVLVRPTLLNRRMCYRAYCILIVLTLLPLLFAPAIAAEVLGGRPDIISGDRLSLKGRVLRLTGIDAPEDGQRCLLANGREFDCATISRSALQDLTAGVDITCVLTGERSGDQEIALCRAGGYDLSRGMAHTGWALAWPRKGTIYARIGAAAKMRKRGLWRGAFTMPWDWRRGIRVMVGPN